MRHGATAEQLQTEMRTLSNLLQCQRRRSVAAAGRCDHGRAPAMRRRLARRSARISTPPPMKPRRCIGAACRRSPTRSPCPMAPSRLTRFVDAPPALARRLSHIGIVSRALGPGAAERIEARPAPGQPRRRCVALGRLHGRRRCAKRRGQAARRAQPACRRSKPRRQKRKRPWQKRQDALR